MRTIELAERRAASLRRAFLRSAALGAIGWAIFAAWARPPLAAALFLLAPLVLVPLGLRLAAPVAVLNTRFLWGAAALAGLPAAGLLLIAFALEPGPLAAAFAVPWGFFTLLVAALGLLRFASRLGGPLEEVTIDAGMVYLTVGGFWTVVSRSGRPLIGFGDPIALLTGVHFHYAAFVLFLLFGLAARAGRRPGDWLRPAAALGLIAGVPLLAAAITLAARGVLFLEPAAASFMAAAAALAACVQLRASREMERRAMRLLLGLSSLSLLLAMGPAVLYGFHSYAAWSSWLDIPAMVRLHGTLNALGFALPALFAWTFFGERSREAAGLLEDWRSRAIHAEAGGGPRPGDARDAHERVIGRERPGEPEPSGLHRRAAAAILRFDVFPGRILSAALSRAPVEVGDTVACVDRPFPGTDLFFASRVVARFDGREGGLWRTGFTYRTLDGHPELGEETFAVEKDLSSGEVRVALRSWSRPGKPVVRLFRPLARRLQLAAARAALEHLAAEARGAQGAASPRAQGRRSDGGTRRSAE